jgi:hypothetical protein
MRGEKKNDPQRDKTICLIQSSIAEKRSLQAIRLGVIIIYFLLRHF